MQKSLPKLFPSSTETAGIAFVSLLIVLLGNGKDLLERYGLLNSSQLVQKQLGNQVGSGLGKLDTFKFTDSVVSFAVWGVVGLISFSLLQAVLRTSNQIKYHKAVGSNRYVHPANFTRERFWRHIVIDTALSFGFLLLIVATVVFYFTYTLPKGFTHARRFLLHVSVTRVGDLLLGLVMVFVGTYLVYAAVRLALRHYHTTRVA
jgi:hypothetical protein